MKTASLALLSILFLATGGLAGEAIPAKTLQDLKGGTVFLRVKAGANSASGSGFLIHADGTTGYIITNWHVIHVPVGTGLAKKLASSIDVVFFSGSKDEAVYKAEIAASLPNVDLAVLRVKDAKELPAPLKVAANVNLTETMPLFCLGFPFGNLLGIDNRNPAITVSKATVSSLRHGKHGELVTIQIDGALNPGNSGGPVVDAQGHIVGVAVAAIKGAQIGFAIPAAEVTSIINGRAVDANVQLAKTTGSGMGISVDVKLADPLQRLRSVVLHYVRQGKEESAMGQLKPLIGATKAELRIKDRQATGTVSLPDDKAVSYWLQIGYTGSDGEQHYLAVSSLRIDAKGSLLVLQGDLEKWKGKDLLVYLSGSDASARQKAVERVKKLVGNTLRLSRSSTQAGETVVQVFPVNDPLGFVERLKEVGQVTKINGGDIYLAVADSGSVIAKSADPKKEPKGTTKPPASGGSTPGWMMDLAQMEFPERPAAGKILGTEFTVKAVKLDPLTLTLRQGRGFFPDAAIIIFHRLKAGESIEGKKYEIDPENGPEQGMPSIHLQQKGPDDKLPRSQPFPFGYAMKLEFGKAKDGVIPGKIYVCLPDETQSFVAGNFMLKLR